MTRSEQSRRKRLLAKRPKLTELERQELSRLEHKWEILQGMACVRV